MMEYSWIMVHNWHWNMFEQLKLAICARSLDFTIRHTTPHTPITNPRVVCPDDVGYNVISTSCHTPKDLDRLFSINEAMMDMERHTIEPNVDESDLMVPHLCWCNHILTQVLYCSTPGGGHLECLIKRPTCSLTIW